MIAAEIQPTRNPSLFKGVKHGRGSARSQNRRSRSADLSRTSISRRPARARSRSSSMPAASISSTLFPHRACIPSPVGLPFIAGNESAGEVIAVGPGVTDLKVGDRVAYVGPLGGYAAERLVPADRTVKLPDNITYEQAAGMMLKGMTAQYLLNRTFKVGKGTIAADACGGRRRRPDPVPVGQSSRRHRDRHRRLQGKGRARQEERLPPRHPLSRRGFRRQGEGDHQRQAVRRGL